MMETMARMKASRWRVAGAQEVRHEEEKKGRGRGSSIGQEEEREGRGGGLRATGADWSRQGAPEKQPSLLFGECFYY